MTELYGVDVSEWQGQIDWDTLNAHSNFVVIRASLGTLRKDYQFDRNQAEARRVRREAGPLGIGYYYFAYPVLCDSIESANFFVDNLGALEEGELLALDLEGNIGPTPVQWAYEWLAQVEARTGVKPGIYLNQSEKNGYDWRPVVNFGYPLWEAQYSGDRTTTPDGSPWPGVEIRQWTSQDQVAGISTLVDGDTFYGDFPDWYACGFWVPPTPPAPVPLPVTPDPTPAVPVTVTPVATPTPPPSPVAQTEYEETYKAFSGGPRDLVLKTDTAAIDVTGTSAPKHFKASRPYGSAGPFKSAGTFTDGGRKYYRGTSGAWYGIPVDDVEDPQVTPPPEPTDPAKITVGMFLKDPLGVLIRLLSRRPV